MMRTKAFFSGLVIAAVLVLAFGMAWRARYSPTHKAPVVRTLRGQTMGTTYSIRLVMPQPVPPAQLLQLRRRADRLLEDLNDAMSTYRPRSTIVRFNRSPVTTPVDVGEAMVTVVRRGLEIGRLTAGAFDITLDADIDAWGFDAGPRRTRPPPTLSFPRKRESIGKLPNTSRDAINRVSKPAQRVSTNPAETKIQVEPTGNLLRKRDPNTRLNLSGIAKGYGVDRLADLVAAMGFGRFMVEIGGEVRVRGTNQTGGPWRIAIEPGDNYELLIMNYENQNIIEKGNHNSSFIIHNYSPVVLLRSGQALATSGTTRNAFTHEGKTYSHILDPRTRAPVRTTLVSVSIVARNCMTADALATAAMVLGESQTRAVLKQLPETHALFVHVDPVTGEARVTYTPGFPLPVISPTSPTP
ncbi:MAG: FAD:protein FMN transferase [Myxococcota bacterium]